MIKFLLVRFSSIGDIVLTTPVIRCLREQVEGAEVYYLTKEKYAAVLEGNPYLSGLFTFGDNMATLLKELKKENFDYIIDLHNNIRSARITYALKRMAFKVDKLNIRKWILVQLKKDLLPDKHIVDRYLETLQHFSITNDGKGLDFFLHTDDEADLGSLCGMNEGDYIAIVVGGGYQTKQIPEESLLRLCENLTGNKVLLGGIEDKEKAGRINSRVRTPGLYDLTGKLSIRQSAYVVKNARLVITPDTGLMHIAAAFGKDIYSVWGNTIPKFGMGPYQPGENSTIYEVQGLSCRPCSKLGFDACPKKHFRCMLEQDYTGMIGSIKNLLSSQD